MRGVPFTLKCPKCCRGKFGYPPKHKGVRATGEHELQRSNVGRGTCHRGQAECLDCGHKWFSTHHFSGAQSCHRDRFGGCDFCQHT